ncbi:MAG: hypothetical protein BWY72_02046 [Bacteroidetes bacterium ADurb.Bin416]|nr:MAG: hypothetical protein BWY72_02046 [Bacteroidetes bacterium ADurb.Bin416]
MGNVKGVLYVGGQGVFKMVDVVLWVSQLVGIGEKDQVGIEAFLDIDPRMGVGVPGCVDLCVSLAEPLVGPLHFVVKDGFPINGVRAHHNQGVVARILLQ